MRVEVDHNLNLIYNIRFKNIKLYINSAVGTLFSKPSGSLNGLKIDNKVNELILKKFRAIHWDTYENKVIHLKFFFFYSPIVSKFIDESELEEIEIVEPTYDHSHMIVIKHNKYYDAHNAFRSVNRIFTFDDKNILDFL